MRLGHYLIHFCGSESSARCSVVDVLDALLGELDVGNESCH